MNKEIETAKEDLSFMNEGDYITKNMANSARVLEDYIQQLEFNIKASKKEHKHDIAMIDEVKGEAVRLYRVLDKVTDKLKEDTQKFNRLRKKHKMYSISEERLSTKYFYAQEILNIIEGEREYCCTCGVELNSENKALNNMCNECKYGLDYQKEREEMQNGRILQ